MKLLIVFNKDKKVLEFGKECLCVEDVKKMISSQCYPSLSNFEVSMNQKDILCGDLMDCGMVNGDKLYILEAVENEDTLERTAISNVLKQSFHQLYTHLYSPTTITTITSTHTIFPPSTSTTTSFPPSPPSFPKHIKEIMVILNALFLSDTNIDTRGFKLKKENNTYNNTYNNTDIIKYTHKHFNKCYFEFVFVPMASHFIVVHGLLKDDDDVTIDNVSFYHQHVMPISLTLEDFKECLEVKTWRSHDIEYRNVIILPLLQAARIHCGLPLLPSLSTLPTELKGMICSYFNDFRDLIRLSELSREWSNVVLTNENAWKRLLIKEFSKDFPKKYGRDSHYKTFKKYKALKIEYFKKVSNYTRNSRLPTDYSNFYGPFLNKNGKIDGGINRLNECIDWLNEC